MSETGYVKQWVSGPRQAVHRISGGDDLGSFTLILYWKPESDGKVMWVDFELFEVTAVENAQLLYGRRGASNSTDTTADLADAEATAHGMVKWDGCTQFDVMSVHVDSRDGLERWLDAIAEARRLCAAAMTPLGLNDVRSEYEDEL